MFQRSGALTMISPIVLVAACTTVQAAPPEIAAPPPALSVETENEMYEFSYSYPAEAAEIPKLKAHLDKDLADSEAELVKQTREAKEDADANGYPYRAHYLSVGWDVAADVPGWLSLSGGFETYSGGAHGMHGSYSLLWDKAADAERDPVDLFVSKDTFRAAIQPEFCRLLDEERAERRGEPVVRSEDDSFSACIDPLENTVLLESAGGKAFDTISVQVGPYMAGPYVEGSYIVDVPVTQAIVGIVRPGFRGSFAVKR